MLLIKWLGNCCAFLNASRLSKNYNASNESHILFNRSLSSSQFETLRDDLFSTVSNVLKGQK